MPKNFAQTHPFAFAKSLSFTKSRSFCKNQAKEFRHKIHIFISTKFLTDFFTEKSFCFNHKVIISQNIFFCNGNAANQNKEAAAFRQGYISVLPATKDIGMQSKNHKKE